MRIKPKIKNEIKMDRIMILGSYYNVDSIKKCFLKIKPKYEIKSSFDYKIEQLTSGKNLILENVFEKSSIQKVLNKDKLNKIKENSQNIYCLVTSVPELVQDIWQLFNYLKENNIDRVIFEQIDYIFHFNGNYQLYPTILKLVEDKENIKYDNERIILVVEDKPLYYSSFLQTIYKINEDRTRIFLARNYEEAKYALDHYSERLAGTIIDLAFPKDNTINYDIAWELKAYIDKKNLKIPIIFQSADEQKIKRIQQSGEVFALYKEDPLLTNKLAEIIDRFFGFGLFEVRLPYGDKRTVAKIRNLTQLKVFIETLSPDILIEHARYNDFSNWLWIQGYKKLAAKLKPIDPVQIMEEIKKEKPGLSDEDVYKISAEKMRNEILQIIKSHK